MKQSHRKERKTLFILLLFLTGGLLVYQVMEGQTPQGEAVLRESRGYVGEYVAYRDAPTEKNLEERLWINEDGTARWQAEYMNSQPPTVDEGTWRKDVNGKLILTITGNIERSYQMPLIYYFSQTEEGIFEEEAGYELRRVQ